MQGFRRFERKLGDRRYKRRFLVAVEGEATEPLYFARFQDSDRFVVEVKCIKGSCQSSPAKVLGRLKKVLSRNGMRDGDEAWVVVDRDQWPEEQLRQVFDWTRLSPAQNHLAVSNPCFELWLLMHFEEGTGVTARDCIEKLRRHVPDFAKNRQVRVDNGQVLAAVERARRRDVPPCASWPERPGQTTVYRLVSKIMDGVD